MRYYICFSQVHSGDSKLGLDRDRSSSRSKSDMAGNVNNLNHRNIPIHIQGNRVRDDRGSGELYGGTPMSYVSDASSIN